MLAAAGDWEFIAPMVIAIGMFVLLPIVYMLLRHQRHMAELYHSKHSSAELEERLRRTQLELDQLRDRVNTQILTADSPSPSIASRIEEPPLSEK